MLRLFAALAVPDFAAERLVHAQSGLDGARWRPPDSLHVTLRFFGGLDNRQIARQLNLDERTIGRDWAAARLWLKQQLQRNLEVDDPDTSA